MNRLLTQMHAQSGRQFAVIGVIVNLILAAVKAIAGIVGNSYALLADAVESTSDVASSLIVLSGLTIAAKPADATHPYGHGKAEPIASMAVAGALLAAAVGLAVENLGKLSTRHDVPSSYTLVVLVLVMAVKELLFRYEIRIGQRAHSTAVKADAWHHRSDAMTSAIAGAGISIALIGGRGYESADNYAALFASCVIAFTAFRLFTPALRELMDAAPPAEIEQDIRRSAVSVPGVESLEKCLVRKMGVEYYVDLHVVVDGAIPVRKGHAIAHDVKEAIRRSNPKISDVLVHIEPLEVHG
jgi:cation diffusion facilitator family transporter